MTTQTDFDQTVAAWLDGMGRTEMRSAAVDAALESARGLGQRRGLRGALAGAQAWPKTQRHARIPHIPARILLVAAFVAALAAAAVIGAGVYLQQRPTLGGGGWITVSDHAGGEVHVLSPDGADQRAGGGRGSNYCSHLSPAGDQLAYSVRHQGLFFESLNGTGRRQIGRFNNYGYKDGIWSPDRARLAYRASGANGAISRLEVVSMPDGTVTTPLTATNDLVSEAAWSPDSRRLAIASARDGQGSIEIVGLDGTRLGSIGPLRLSEEVSMAWSPDGSNLAYLTMTASGATSLVVADLRTGTPHELMTGFILVDPGEQPWSADGQWLALSRIDGNVLIVRADGTQRTVVPATAPAGYWSARWSPVDDIVAIRDGGSILTLHADGTNRRSHPVGPDRHAWDFDWSPDGSRFAVGEVDNLSGALRVTTHDASGDMAPVLIATYPTVGNAPASNSPVAPAGLALICLSWEGPPNGP
ncbi:MAG: PD40 domain-containing protein [Chloroflexi bacterium]|nr:PD40 domain-containing protein [Chloroflexota bacterium]